MFDFAWSEILLIGAVALIAIGPKDMPAAIRTISSMIKKARRMAAEFQTHVDEMVREADLGDVKKAFSDIRNLDLAGALEKHVDPDRSIRKTFEENPFEPTYPTPAAAEVSTLDEVVGQRQVRPGDTDRTVDRRHRRSGGRAAGREPAGRPIEPGRTAGKRWHRRSSRLAHGAAVPVVQAAAANRRRRRHSSLPKPCCNAVPRRRPNGAGNAPDHRESRLWQQLRSTRSTTSRCHCSIT